MGTTVVEVLSPITTFGSYDYVEPATKQVCAISSSIVTDFTKTNPEYTSPIFLSYYPEFGKILGQGGQYESLYNVIYQNANHCLDYRRFGYDWYYLMSAYIAHYFALALQRIYAVNNSAACGDFNTLLGAVANQSTGIAVKESLGGEEIQTDQMITMALYKNAGEYLTTPYGRNFWDRYINYAKNFFRGVY